MKSDKSNIIGITGVTLAGKSTLAKGLIEVLPEARFITSTTTRLPRDSDLPTEYEHVTHYQYAKMVAGGDFFTSIPHGEHWYGIRRAYVERALLGHGTYIRPFTPDVIPMYHEATGGNVILLHLETPPEEIIHTRMSERGMPLDEITSRIIYEKGWDKQISQLIMSGTRIHVIPSETVDATLKCALEILSAT